MQCGNCGFHNKENAKLCEHCGINLARAEYFHPPERVQPPPQPPAKPKAPAKQAPAKSASTPAPKPTSSGKKPAVRSALPGVKTKKRKTGRSSLILLLFALFFLAAVGIFIGRMLYYSGTERYMQTAERFVQAVVLHDEETLSQCIHPDMYGMLRPRSYGAVESCEAEAQSCEAIVPDTLTLPVEEAVTQLYRVQVLYRVVADGEEQHFSMVVYVATIGGETYAVKTEAVEESTSTEPIS